MGELCVSVSLAKRLMCMAHKLPGLSLCEMGLIGTLCAAKTAWPFPLLACRQVSTFPGWGCAFPTVSCWLSAWAKVVGHGGQITDIQCRTWPLCKDKHLCEGAGCHHNEQAECTEKPEDLAFMHLPSPAAWGSNAM